MNSELISLGKKFAMLKELKEHHEHVISLINIELQQLGIKIYEEMTDSDTISFRITGQNLFKDNQDRIISPDPKLKPTVVDEAKLFDFLRKTGHSDLIKETVFYKTLESWITQQKKNNQELPDETILKVFMLKTAKVRRAPKDTQAKRAEGA